MNGSFVRKFGGQSGKWQWCSVSDIAGGPGGAWQATGNGVWLLVFWGCMRVCQANGDEYVAYGVAGGSGGGVAGKQQCHTASGPEVGCSLFGPVRLNR